MIRNLIRKGASKLLNSESAMLDSELLLCRVLKITREQLYCQLNGAVDLDNKQILTYLNMIKQRSRGIPIAYLLNEKEFLSRKFYIDKSVLVPRPETETLVELVLKNINHNQQLNVLELGTGSGIISASIAKERPRTSITAVDICSKAIAVARKNLEDLRIDNVILCVADWSMPLKKAQCFDIIVSNPPYVSKKVGHELSDEVYFEPKKSIFSQDNGLADLKKIISQAPHLLTKNGKIFLEHGKDQARAVRTLLEQNNFESVSTYCDLNRLERVSTGLRRKKIISRRYEF